MIVKEIEGKDIMKKTNLPMSDYAVNPYVGCTHACKYCSGRPQVRALPVLQEG